MKSIHSGRNIGKAPPNYRDVLECLSSLAAIDHSTLNERLGQAGCVLNDFLV